MNHRRGRGIRTFGSLLALGAVAAFLTVMPASGEVVPPPLATSSNVHLVGHIPGTRRA